MASIRKRGRRWHVEVCVNGQRGAGSFATRAEAAAWALAREAELSGKRLPVRTLGDALARYATEVSPTKRGERWECLRLAKWQREMLASRRLTAISTADLAGWRDARLASVSGATVAREYNLLRSVLEVARREWGWLSDNPINDVRRPTSPPARRRRVTEDESDRVVLALGYAGGEPENISQRVALAWLFALETAMRSGEILGLRWADIAGRVAVLPRTKNGDRREVPLSSEARRLLSLLPRDVKRPVFDLVAGQRDALFRKARDRAEVLDLHFHDSRAEAVWRLSRKLDVMQLARVIGHRDIRSLMLYYNESADSLAERLG